MCHLRPEPLTRVSEFCRRTQAFWEGKLDRFAAYVEDLDG